jgi:hypothetical protein
MYIVKIVTFKKHIQETLSKQIQMFEVSYDDIHFHHKLFWNKTPQINLLQCDDNVRCECITNQQNNTISKNDFYFLFFKNGKLLRLRLREQ